MKRNVTVLTEQEYDLVVVGGGIFGVAAAWDATLRGLSTALIEQGDFGQATSAHHFKVVHGGIRYLQHGDVYRVRESSAERSAFLRMAPHLVRPLPFVIPTYGHGMKGKEAMKIALWLYDLLTFDRNRDIKDTRNHIPSGRTISASDCLAMFPHLDKQGLTGAAIFHDGQMYNPPRLTLAFVQAAAAAGADVANYVEATGFMRDGDRVVGVEARDKLSGDKLEIRGRVVLNAAGPWASWLLDGDGDLRLKHRPVFSRDAYFVVKQKLVDNHALAVQGQTKDPDALLSRGNRHLFLVPWRDYTLLGVWHVVHKDRPETFTVTEGDLQGFLDEINLSYPALNLTLADVSRWNAGLTLFGENKPGAIDLSYGKRSIIIDHAKDHRVNGLISLIGVRFTTARGIAEKTVNLVFEKLGKRGGKSATAVTPLHGGDFDTFDQLLSQAERERPSALPAELMPELLQNYGAAYKPVLKYANENPALAAPVGATTVLKAEVVHAIRDEVAQKLSDIVLRRTDLGAGEYPGETAVQTCADLMAAELGWDERRTQQEIAEVKAEFPLI
ncbi:MAG: glycerol-3-phosphate dehydrogenase/oxidase [Chloroflexi bacterium]|nr:glycerol-3-phosphate dehydrogenase/oxidase [Chloroflexota bacterium]